MIRRTSVRQRGFTLIEMMVVVLIIGILSAVAFPSYVSYVQKSRRFEAQAVMYEVAAYMERYYTENNSYTSAVLPSSASSNSFYEITLVDHTSQTYKVQSKPEGSQVNDECGTLTLAHTGAYTAARTGCWK